MSGALEFRARLASRNFDVHISVEDGENVAVLGPNGAGKSTLLSILSGTLRPDAGSARLGDSLLFDVGQRGGEWKPPHTREVALLAQEPLLFPHMSVSANVAYGPRARGASRAEAREAAKRWLERVGSEAFSSRRPCQLSGGQAQRVAVARALAAEPRLLMLDEPMAAMDVGAKPALRKLLREVLPGRTTLMVTHDLLDAMLLSQRVIILEAGRVAEQGPTTRVLTRPRTAFAAGLAGLNFVSGKFDGDGLCTKNGMRVRGVIEPCVGARSTTTSNSSSNLRLMESEQAVVAVFPPSAVEVSTAPCPGAVDNCYWGQVEDLEPHRDLITVRGRTRGGEVLSADATLGRVHELGLQPGCDAVFTVDPSSVAVYAV